MEKVDLIEQKELLKRNKNMQERIGGHLIQEETVVKEKEKKKKKRNL